MTMASSTTKFISYQLAWKRASWTRTAFVILWECRWHHLRHRRRLIGSRTFLVTVVKVRQPNGVSWVEFKCSPTTWKAQKIGFGFILEDESTTRSPGLTVNPTTITTRNGDWSLLTKAGSFTSATSDVIRQNNLSSVSRQLEVWRWKTQNKISNLTNIY